MPKRVRPPSIPKHPRTCPVCGGTFMVHKPSQKQRCCSHKCAWTEIGPKVLAAALTPEAKAKVVVALRARGDGKTGYVKRGGRHEHRVVVEERLGRPLTPDEIVHHRDENKRNNADQNLELTTRAGHARIHFHETKRAVIKRRQRSENHPTSRGKL